MVVDILIDFKQGVAKRCRLFWLTNSALVYEPKCRGYGVSANEYCCTQEPKLTLKILLHSQPTYELKVSEPYYEKLR
jgi:hypothetical protein